MLRRLTLSSAIFLAALFSFPAKADLFNYSYTFSSGDVVAGSFMGTVNGLFVDNVSNVSALFNGTTFNGSPNLFAVNWDPSSGNWDNTTQATVSFDGNLNNFMFVDSNFPADPSFTNYFFMVDVDGGGNTHQAEAFFNSGTVSDATGSGFDASRWSLSVTSPVPEPEIYAMLAVGLGLIGWVGRRKKPKASA